MGVSSAVALAASDRGWLWSLLGTGPGRRLGGGVLVVALALNLAGGEVALARPGAGTLGDSVQNPRSKIENPYGNPVVWEALRGLGLLGPGDPVDEQFQVNGYTTSHQQRPGVGMDDDGDFVVVWESYGSSGGDTAGYSIQGQRYNRAGVPQGGQFQVNTFTTGDQRYPDVAVDGNGDFVVVWQSLGEDGSGESVQGRRFNSLGVAQGGAFQVNTYTTGDQFAPAVAIDEDGDFVVVWHSDGSAMGDSSGYSIQGQRYNGVGVAQGGNFQVNMYGTGQQWFPAVAMDRDGDFVVVWGSNGSSGGDGDGYSVQGQRYNSAGVMQGGQFQVNTYTTSQQDRPAVAMDGAGNFVVVWMSEGGSGGDTAGYSIQGQRYNSVGVALGGEFQVNSYSTDDQQFPAVAMDGAGNFVVSWQSNGSAGSDDHALSVQGQRFDAGGTVLGEAWQVNRYTLGNQHRPAMGMDRDGDFVIVWQSTGSPGNDEAGESIQGQRFGNSVGYGWDFQVNSYTSGGQTRPDVALDSDGDFVVVWESAGSGGSDTSGTSIQGQRYDSAGVPQGNQFQVNQYTTGAQGFPAVGLDSDGDFVVVWQSDGSAGGDTAGYSIQGRRFDRLGVAQGGQFQVNGYASGDQTRPDVALDSDGDFVVVWQSDGGSGDNSGTSVQGQRYNSVGGAQGGQFQVNSYTTGDQGYAAVSLDSTGDFVVVWQSAGGGGDYSGTSIQGQRYNSVGVGLGGQFRVNNYVTNDQRYPDVGLDSTGDFVVVWQSSGSGSGVPVDTAGESIQGRRYSAAGTAQGGQFQVNQYTTGDQGRPAVTLDSDGDFVVIWQSLGSGGSDRSLESVQGRIFSPGGLRLLGEFQVNGYTTGGQGEVAVSADASGDFVVAWASDGSGGNDRDGRSIQGARFELGQLDFQVNEYSTGNQRYPAVAVDNDGDFVVVWESAGSAGDDSSGYSIQGRLFDENGVPVGDEFQVNGETVGDQRRPVVALDFDGDFVVVWTSETGDGSGLSVQGRLYNRFGTAQGGQFQVNMFTTGDQREPAVAMDGAGNFVVVWESEGGTADNSGFSIQGQRYDAAGVAQGAPFQVNSYVTNEQRNPAVGMDEDGDFVVVWESEGADSGDTSGFSIQGQRYERGGAAVGGQFQVNTYTTGEQTDAAVAMDSSGAFVVVWQSLGEDGSGGSVQGQRYDSGGAAVGGQFQVNMYTTGGQERPAVSLDRGGDFVVSWQSEGSDGHDEDGFSVQAQRYSSMGVAQGENFQVNRYTTNDQGSPAVAVDGDGDFVVVWQSVGLGEVGGEGRGAWRVGRGGKSDERGVEADGDSGIAASRFAAEGGPEPTAIRLQTAEADAPHRGSGLVLMGAGVAAGLMGLWLRWRKRGGWGE